MYSKPLFSTVSFGVNYSDALEMGKKIISTIISYSDSPHKAKQKFKRTHILCFLYKLSL